MLIPYDARIMVVDGAKMSILRNAGNPSQPHLEMVDLLESPMPRTSAIGGERPGRSSTFGQPARSAMQSPDLHQLAEADFARSAAERLEQLLDEEGQPTILVAEPRVLGEMRRHLDDRTRARLHSEIDKDYAGRSATEITDLLKRYEP